MLSSVRCLFVLAVSAICCLSFADNQGTYRFNVNKGAMDPAVSPNGKTIAVSILGTIWTVPIGGGQATQITRGNEWDTHPAWSLDGKSVAFARLNESGKTQLILRNLTDGKQQSLNEINSGINQIVFHPNGKEIYYVDAANQYTMHVHSISVNGGEPKAITWGTNSHERTFCIAPDGQRIIYDSGHYGTLDLYEYQLETEKITRLTRTKDDENNPIYLPEGRILYLKSLNAIDHFLIASSDGQDISEPLFSSSYNDKQLSLVPGGQSVVMCGGRKLYQINLKSGESKEIPFNASFEIDARPSNDVLVVNARLFSGLSDEYVPDSNILIRNGKIVAVTSGQVDKPNSVKVIDAKGKVVMSGLMDNHYHYWNPYRGVYLLNLGITSIRDPGVLISESMQYKDSMKYGITHGPMIYSCGPLVDGVYSYHPMVDVKMDDPSAMERLVVSLKNQGADAIKAYFMLPSEELKALCAAADKHNMPVTGHLGVQTGLGEASDYGIEGLNHLRAWRDLMPLDIQPDGYFQTVDAKNNLVARLQCDWSEVDPTGAKAVALAKKLASHGTALDPTLSIQVIRPSLKERVNMYQYQEAVDSFNKMGRFIQVATDLGVPLLAGTDNQNLHKEMQIYAHFGISHAEILRAATINGARWLHKGDEFGTVEPGKRGDLIIIDGDPLKDMKDIEKIVMVIQEGRVVAEPKPGEQDAEHGADTHGGCCGN